MNEQALPAMKITGVMHFADRPHLIYTLHDAQYLSLRPLVDQIGLDWRTQKKGLLDDDALLFYGTLLLEDGKIVQPPCKYSPKNSVSARYTSAKGQKTADFDGENAQITNKNSPKNAVSASPNSEKGRIIADFCSDDAQKDTVFIHLRRVYMFLARISVANIKAKGNMSAAEYMLGLQEEWADALHDYETDGIAVKASHIKFESSKVRDFLAVCKEKRSTDDAGDRKVLHSLMKDLAEKIGYPYQSDLLDE
jgi:hypothetical protein